MENQIVKYYVVVGDEKYPVESLEAASKTYRAVIKELNVGSSEIPAKYVQPKIFDAQGKLVGYIAYNGRVFPGLPKDWKSELEPLYDSWEEGKERRENDEPQPEKFRIIPHYSPVTSALTSFTVEDPAGSPVTKWREYVTKINKQYPAIPLNDLEEAKVDYLKYRAVFTLGRVSFALNQIKGKPATSELNTPQRLARYGVSEEDYEKVIEMDRNHSLGELQELCRQKGLSTGGDKKKLISRLLEAEHEQR